MCVLHACNAYCLLMSHQSYRSKQTVVEKCLIIEVHAWRVSMKEKECKGKDEREKEREEKKRRGEK